MSTTAKRPGQPKRAKSNFAIYREGGTTRDIRLTINLVLVARRWRSLLDERLRLIGQSSARMEALAAIINSPSLSAQVDIAKRLRIEGPTMTRMLDTLESRRAGRAPARSGRPPHQAAAADPGGRDGARGDLRHRRRAARPAARRDLPAEQIDELNAFLVMLTDRLDAGLPRASRTG